MMPYSKEQKKHGRKNDTHTVKRIIQAFRPYRFQVALVLIVILLTTLLGLVNPLLIARVLDDAIQKGDATLLLIYVATIVVTTIVTGIIGMGQSYLNNKIGQNVMYDLRNQLYQHLQSMPLHFFTGTQTGEIQSRLSNDVGGIQAVVTNTATNLISNISVAVSTIIAMVIISPLLTLMTFVLLPLFLWVTYKVGNIQRQTSKETQKSLASLTALTQETLSVSGILLVKVFGQQQYAQKRFKQENRKLGDLMIRQFMIGRWLFTFISTFFAIIPALILLGAGEQIIHNAPILGSYMTLGTIAAFAVLQYRLFFPIGQLLNSQVEIQGSLALFDRIFEYLDLPIDITDKPNALRLKPQDVRGAVTFRNVTFNYKRDVYSALTGFNNEEKQDEGKTKHPASPKSDASVEKWTGTSPVPMAPWSEEPRPALKNISFTIKPGQLAALVGPSGAGKTTITYMIPRLYDVDSGAVEIDNINVKELAQTSLSQLTGVVTQETYLFHASIRENLLYARPDATEAEMIAAAQAAAIHERIMELEDGYDTIVGERGYKLSGGEKQRTAIARVLLKNPRILILDEATSALDTHSERLVQAALERLMKGRTTLAIAHRLSTILAADVILVVNKGEIVERGTHQELLALRGLYAQLYYEQFSSVGTGEAQGPVPTNPVREMGAHADQTGRYELATGFRTGAVATGPCTSPVPTERPIQQTAPIFETQTPHLQALETMLKKTVSPTGQPRTNPCPKRQFILPPGVRK